MSFALVLGAVATVACAAVVIRKSDLRTRRRTRRAVHAERARRWRDLMTKQEAGEREN